MRTALVAGLLALAPIGAAEAHIHMLQPMSRQTDAQGDPQKQGPCGAATLVRTPARVSTYAPGATVMVMWSETINHPGHFRIAFQPDGQNFHVPPPGGAAGNFPDVDQTGMTDAATGTMVLKDMVADGTTQFEITLPNMECTNCTLQFIQVMTGAPPYEPNLANQNDLYFNCADLVLAANAPDAGPMVVTGEDAGVDPGGGGGGGGGVQTVTGGCAAGGSGAGWAALGLLGFVGVRRRRRR